VHCTEAAASCDEYPYALARHAALWLAGAWWPCELLPSNEVDVQVVNGLAAMLALVHHQTVALFQALLLGNTGSSYHHMSQYCCMLLLRCGDASQPVTLLGNDDDVHCSCWSDVSEGIHRVIVVDLGGWDVAIKNLLEDCVREAICVQG